ncbi:MAG: prepilin peptidase [Pirellulaceae bacterium]
MPLLFSARDLYLLLPDIMQMFLAVWLFAVGACVGSFVNVVALRLPAGIGIARSSSRCNRCLHPIRWYDNIPLVSWLVLGGRCRDCGVRISARYPLIELLVGLLFLALALGEGLIAGRNLPLPADAGRYHFLEPSQYWTLYAFHSLLLTTLFTVALIKANGDRVPRRLFWPALVVGLGLSPFVGWLHPVSFRPLAGVPSWVLGAADAVLGGLSGLVMGCFVWPQQGRRAGRWPGDGSELYACALCGIYLGWQATVAVALLATSGYLVATLVTRIAPRWRTGPWCGFLTIAVLVYILQWRRAVELWPLLGRGGSLTGVGLLALAIYGVSRLTRYLTPSRRFVPPAETPLQGDTMALGNPAERLKAILDSPSYLPVEYDVKFLQRPELRPVRVQLELLKPELGFTAEGVSSTVVVFGGTQVIEEAAARQALERAKTAWAAAPDDAQRQRDVARCERVAAKSVYYDAARKFAQLVSLKCQTDGQRDFVITTGGGPGVMEAANRGAHDVGAKSVGLNITLPAEQAPNPYITPDLCFQFHYFALRKMHFLMRAKALVVFPGGFGTLDELFDALTLRQTQRMQQIPIILFGRDYWTQVINFQFLADEGVIADAHLDLISYAETPEEAWNVICQFHRSASG